MNILGVSCYYHDSAAALLADGLVVAAAEEERFSRVKHDRRFPHRAIAFCLTRAGLSPGDLDHVVFYEKPLLKFERILMTALRSFPRSWRTFGESMIAWFDEKLWIKASLQAALGMPAERILFTEHHLAHAASAFFCSPFTDAAVLTVDGVGEWTTAAIGVAAASWSDGRNDIRLTGQIEFPHSLGLLYSAFTAFLGFEVNEGEYKVMGMAPYGSPRYVDRVSKLIAVSPDGSFELDLDYFSYHYSPDRTFSQKFVELFGDPRAPESEFVTSLTDPGGAHPGAVLEKNQYYADIAASIQRVTEDVLLKMARHAHSSTGLSKLCIAGGVALNSLANGRIVRETPFKEVFIQPAAGDSGGALGAALYAYHVLLGRPRRYVMEDGYLGQDFTEGEAREAADEAGLPYVLLSDENQLVERVADDLARGKVVGWVQGRFEWGPRALGNRSILADPRRREMKEIVNRKIKFREPFRPFAPVVAEQDAPRYFDLPNSAARQYPARYMLLVMPWKAEASDAAPAVNHMGTGRLQTVRREWNPLYYDVLSAFGGVTGTPILLNTSFNLRGEPMVASPGNAVRTFMGSGIDVLVMGNVVVRKE